MCFQTRFVCIVIALMFAWIPLVVVVEAAPQAAGSLVKVGNLIISQADVDRRAQEILPMQVSFHGALTGEKIAEIKQKALEELIERAYKVQYAIREEISIDATTFENDWQKRIGNSPKPTTPAQAAQLSKIKADFYLSLLARKAETVAVDEKITVNDKKVTAYYAENKAKYFRPKLYTASHIFVKLDPSDNAEEKEAKRVRAEDLFKKAKAGEDFYNLAYYQSDDRSKYVGGSLGSFHAGQTVPEFDAAIQTMKLGEIVGPVRTMYGFHIIKLDAAEVERQLQFDEVSAKIRASLTADERERLYGLWMSKLKDEYPIERFEQ